MTERKGTAKILFMDGEYHAEFSDYQMSEHSLEKDLGSVVRRTNPHFYEAAKIDQVMRGSRIEDGPQLERLLQKVRVIGGEDEMVGTTGIVIPQQYLRIVASDLKQNGWRVEVEDGTKDKLSPLVRYDDFDLGEVLNYYFGALF